MMRMKNMILAAALVFALAACGKEASEGKNDDAKKEFDAWIAKYHPGIQPTALGSYILEEVEGTGAPVADSAYVRVRVTATRLDSTVFTTTEERVARQLGQYSKANYYGPTVWRLSDNGLYAGLEELVKKMKIGGAMTAVIPGWLNTFNRYSSPEKYIQKASGNDYIFSFRIVDAFDDADRWETDSLSRFLAANYPNAVKDTTVEGFWHVVLEPGRAGEKYMADSTFYIDYVGSRLDGTIFDTNLADSAKVAGLYSVDKSYDSHRIYLDDKDYTKNTLGGSSVIGGFARGLAILPPEGRILCFFTSSNGYAASGSGSIIPAFCPLCFEIIDTEED